MIKPVQIILSFCLILMSSNIAHSHSMGDSELQNVISKLFIWMEEQNHFDFSNIVAPQLKIVDTNKMCLLAYGNSIHKINNSKQCSVIKGLYNYQNKTVYINHDVDLNSKKGQAIILHELVHHFQYESGEADKVKNINQLEYLAYFLEKKFINQNSLLVSNKHFN